MTYSTYRVRLLKEIFKQGYRDRDWRHNDPQPVVSLEYFFEGNPQKDSIAPNLMDKHPGLDFFFQYFRNIRIRRDVKDVLVNIHNLDDIIGGDVNGWPSAGNVHILTSASSII